MNKKKYTNIVWMKFWNLEIIEDLWLFNWRRFAICNDKINKVNKKINFYNLIYWCTKWVWKTNTHSITHWMSSDKFYKTYRWLLNRCKYNNDKNKHYAWKWIRCEWRSFEEFKNDMYKSYLIHIKTHWEKETTIDRINSNWNYCRYNCKWSTMKQQLNNRSNNRILEYKWEKLTISYWSNLLKIPQSTISKRLKYWWSIDKTLSTLVRKRKDNIF